MTVIKCVMFDFGKLSDLEFYRAFQNAYQLQGVTMGEFFNRLGSVLWIDWDMVEIRDWLKRRGIVTVLVTNMNPYHAWYIRRKYPPLMAKFDHGMISCEEGVAKPDPEAWIRPLDCLGFKAEECIFVDDSMENIEAACRLGIKGWHYNITDQHYCQNGKLDEERMKFKVFLAVLDSCGILYDKPRP
ncbi:MAG: HAD family phosphatase [Candidatus Taylorbacteria bacterium]|nr:HAD family phosphatase [Candidatus Taylorbacteria bacterium]